MQIQFDLKNQFQDLNETTATSFWQSNSESVKSIFERFYPTLLFSTPWSTEIDIFLIFIRLFPLKNKAAAEVFNKAVEILITFRTVYYSAIGHIICKQ